MNSDRFNLSPEELAAVFPYHFVIDKNCSILQYGRGLVKVCPAITTSISGARFFSIQRPNLPFTFATIQKHQSELFLLSCSGTGILLRGQMLWKQSAEQIYFLGSPWFTDADAVLSAGLGLNDFPIHDAAMETLMVMQTQKTVVTELKETTLQLSKQKKILTQINTQLETRNQELSEAVSARNQAEERLKLLSLVADHTTNGVIITDPQGLILWVNEGFTRLTEYTLAEAVGRVPGPLLQRDDTDFETRAYMRRQITAGQPFRASILNYSKSGRAYWAEIDAFPIRDEVGYLTHFIAIESDITERIRADQALRAEKELLAATLNTIIDGVIVVDQDQKVKFLNPAAEQYTGWSSLVAEGEDLNRVLCLRDLVDNSVLSPMQIAFDVGQIFGDVHLIDKSYALASKNGSEFTVVVCAIPMTQSDPKGEGGLIVFRDISKELESEKVKQNFVHAVSHELLTPLTSISGFIATLQGEPEMEADTRLSFLKIIDQQSHRLKLLVQDLLEVSQFESGHSQFQDETLDLREIVDRSFTEVWSLAQTKNQSLWKNIPSESVSIVGDPVRLQSVITNLLTNAIKFTPVLGKIELSLMMVNRTAILTVQDTGIGIPEEDLPRVFDKFFRVNRPKLQIPGTGLGLSIVKHIVEHYGGSVQVESKINSGALFRILLPLGRSQGLI